MNGERQNVIGAGLSRLCRNIIAAVVLRDVEGLFSTETPEVVDISVSPLKSRVHRGRVLGRKNLEARLAEPGWEHLTCSLARLLGGRT